MFSIRIGYGNKYNADVAGQVDVIVTFKDNLQYFNQNCKNSEVGTFCTNNKLTDAARAEIESKIKVSEDDKNCFRQYILSLSHEPIQKRSK